MISVNRNFGSLVGQLNLKAANSAVETAVQRLSSGARVNSAADDSAGLAVVSKMDSQIKGLSVALKNTADAIGMFDTASAGLQTTSNIAQRVRELAIQNSNGHLSSVDRAAGQLEVSALMSNNQVLMSPRWRNLRVELTLTRKSRSRSAW